MISIKQPLQTKSILNLTVTFRPANSVATQSTLIKYANKYFPDVKSRDEIEATSLIQRFDNDLKDTMFGYAWVFARITKLVDTVTGETFDQDYLFDNFTEIASEDLCVKLHMVMQDEPIAN